MALFGRNKDEDEDYDEDEVDEEERDLEERRLTRKLKDLHRENRKKRKEPPKPWGKQERIIILVILGVTILVASFLAITSRDVHFSLNSISIPKFDFGSLNIFKEETIILENK